MDLYKATITTNNTDSRRKELFNTPIIKEIWRKLVPKMQLSDFFIETNQKLIPTYSEITMIMRDRYGLEMCTEWTRAFPPQP